MEHSGKFEKIKWNYDHRSTTRWNKYKVAECVRKPITNPWHIEDWEYEEIVGEPFPG